MSLKSSVVILVVPHGWELLKGSAHWMCMAEFRQRESKCDKMCQWAMGAEEAF